MAEALSAFGWRRGLCQHQEVWFGGQFA